MSTPKFRVAICGGGPGGLALASIIAKYNDPAAPVAVDLYESQEKIGTVGAGISVWPRTRVLLQKVGLMESFKGELGADDSGGTKVKGFTFRLSDAGKASREVYQMSVPSDPMLLHRSTFITALLDSLPPPPLCAIHTSKRLTGYTSTSPDGPLTLHFADGSTREADVIIGADGVRSTVRETMFRSGGDDDQARMNYTVEPKWTGVTAYRSLVTKSMLEGVRGCSRQLTTPMIYCGKGRHIVTYPISRGELVNFIAFVTTPGGYGTPYKGKWVRDATPEEMRACYKGWEPEAQAILDVAERVSAWAIHIMESVPHCAVGKAAILGDALHAMETHFGAGAGQAMEDAYILARVLTHNLTDKSRLAAALRAYETSRLAFSTSVVARARKVGQIYEFEAGERPPVGVYDKSEGLSVDDEEIEAWGQRWGQRITNEWSFQWSDDRIVDAFWTVAETELLKLEEDST